MLRFILASPDFFVVNINIRICYLMLEFILFQIHIYAKNIQK